MTVGPAGSAHELGNPDRPIGSIDPADAERIIAFHRHGVARYQDVLDTDRTLVAAAMSVARATARFVAPLEEGGEDGWRALAQALIGAEGCP